MPRAEDEGSDELVVNGGRHPVLTAWLSECALGGRRGGEGGGGRGRGREKGRRRGGGGGRRGGGEGEGEGREMGRGRKRRNRWNVGLTFNSTRFLICNYKAKSEEYMSHSIDTSCGSILIECMYLILEFQEFHPLVTPIR